MSEVYAGFELLGWYSLSDDLGTVQESIHKQISEFNESPLVLQIRPSGIGPGLKEVPILLYVGQEKGTGLVFLPQAFTVDASDTERCVVESVFSGLSSSRGDSSRNMKGVSGETPPLHPAVSVAQSRVAALSVFSERLALIASFVDAQKKRASELAPGAILDVGVAGRGILRSIRSLLSRVPVWGGEEVAEALSRETLDALLVATSAGVMCGGVGMSALAEKLGVLEGSLLESSGEGGGERLLGKLSKGGALDSFM